MSKQDALQALLAKMDTLIGGRSKSEFRAFVETRWANGEYAFKVDDSFRDLIHELVALYEAGEFPVVDCYQPDQVPASNATIYDETYAIRMVKDSPDGTPQDQPIRDYNIEPHIHFVPSIIIVASRPDRFVGHYLLHRREADDEFVAAVPLEFGNAVCFPEHVSHTFKPSDTGLITLNMTEQEIVPQTPEFGTDAPISMDALKLKKMLPV